MADYAPIPNAYVELPNTTLIANEAAISRSDGVPIFYSLKITQDGLLSLSYSINGGAYQPVITKQSITASNGALPANFLFGFAGSTGGSTNIHEILCFKADPATTTGSSAGASEKQSAKLETGAQAYFAFYNPANWTGRVTASGLGLDSFGNVIVAVTPNWDASCALSGVIAGDVCQTTGVAGPVAAQAAVGGTRNILSWNGTMGIPLTFSSLTTSPSGGQAAAINLGDAAPLPACSASIAYSTDQRLNYLRGDHSCEVNSAGVGRFRARTNLLGDIIDSSPTWVGPPISPYAVTWSDRYRPTSVMPEAGGTAQTYAQYITTTKTRTNVVYVGANDGMLHGFRSGYYDATGAFNATGNDGSEVLAYMPATVLAAIHQYQTLPAPAPSLANIDFPNTQYAHAFYVDAAPGTGDVFYGGTWHTWVVGGLGAGGQAIYALDVSSPSTFAQTPAAATAIVKGEWNSSTLTCPNTANCKNNLGYTYGTPQLRRLHDGKWAVIFGNGFGSTSGDAGIFVMTIDPSTAASTFYYLSTGTGTAASPNGISYTSPADLDGDHVTDFVYAGDLKGNIWRFDLPERHRDQLGGHPGTGVHNPRRPADHNRPGNRLRCSLDRGAAAADDPLRLRPEEPGLHHGPGYLCHRHPDPVRGVGLEYGQLEQCLRRRLRQHDSRSCRHGRGQRDEQDGGEDQPAAAGGHDQRDDHEPRHHDQLHGLLGGHHRLHDLRHRQVRLVHRPAGHPGAGDLQPRARGPGAHGQHDRAGEQPADLVHQPERHRLHLRGLRAHRSGVQPGVPAAQRGCEFRGQHQSALHGRAMPSPCRRMRPAARSSPATTPARSSWCTRPTRPLMRVRATTTSSAVRSA